MKKYTLLSLLCLGLVLVSCSKDSPNIEELKEEGFDTAALEAKLLGTWTLESISYDGEPSGLTDCTRQTSITITTDLRHNSKSYDNDNDTDECYMEADVDGWFEIADEEPETKIITKNEISPSIIVLKYEVTATTLRLTSVPTNGTIVDKTFVKQ